MFKDFLDKGHCFKLVCGAGNEDIEDIKRLVWIYANAGCRFFDLSASEDVVDIAKEALAMADVSDAYLCVSVGIKNDPHVNKALISKKTCISCGACRNECLENAISEEYEVNACKCIGCMKCSKVCTANSISYYSAEKDLDKVLPSIISKNIDCIEFHAMGSDEDEIFSKWNYICKTFDGIVSICTSRGKLSDEGIVDRIKRMIAGRKPYSTIVQADGFPMSGGSDDYKTTLQAVATAEIVQNEKLPVYLLLSGGTNTKTSQLAKMCSINYSGISVGSYARKIVKEYITNENFWDDKAIQEQAIRTAKILVESATV